MVTAYLPQRRHSYETVLKSEMSSCLEQSSYAEQFHCLHQGISPPMIAEYNTSSSTEAFVFSCLCLDYMCIPLTVWTPPLYISLDHRPVENFKAKLVTSHRPVALSIVCSNPKAGVGLVSVCRDFLISPVPRFLINSKTISAWLDPSEAFSLNNHQPTRAVISSSSPEQENSISRLAGKAQGKLLC